MAQSLTKDILEEYGFKIDDSKTKDRLMVLVRDRVEIVIVDDGTVMYSNMGFDYPLLDLLALKKLYKELRRTELTKA